MGPHIDVQDVFSNVCIGAVCCHDVRSHGDSPKELKISLQPSQMHSHRETVALMLSSDLDVDQLRLWDQHPKLEFLVEDDTCSSEWLSTSLQACVASGAFADVGEAAALELDVSDAGHAKIHDTLSNLVKSGHTVVEQLDRSDTHTDVLGEFLQPALLPYNSQSDL